MDTRRPQDAAGNGHRAGVPSGEIFRLGANGPSLTAVLAAVDGTTRRLALLHLDVDGIGTINATLGENVVAQALRMIARRLQQVVPADGWLWRLGSEQFIAAVAYGEGEADGETLAERLREAFEAPLHVRPFLLEVTLSIGIAIYPRHAHDAAHLLMAAEEAMRRARRSGPGGQALQLADAGSDPESVAEREQQGRRVVDAIAQSEFQLYYQPVVSALDGSIATCCALLRWHNAQEGVLRANRVLPAVERAGVAEAVGQWTIETALLQLQKWRDAGLPHVHVAVPLDAALLARDDCAARIGTMLRDCDLEGASVEFEVSEAVLSLDAPHVIDTLSALRAMGGIISVSDFGTCGLSLSALAQQPLDRLKIDRGFLRNVTSDPRSAALLRGLIALGHHLGLTLVAKGVETDAELAFLRRAGCDFFQGYLFSPPLPGPELDALLARQVLLPQAFRDSPAEPSARTLLLLDDEENVLRSLVRVLRREGYQLVTAGNVAEAFDLLARHDVQVVVSDQRMPDMQGTEFLARVRDLYPQTARLVLSGYTELDIINLAIQQQAAHWYLPKPWDDDQLRAQIHGAFLQAEQRRAIARQEAAGSG